VIVAPSVECV